MNQRLERRLEALERARSPVNTFCFGLMKRGATSSGEIASSYVGRMIYFNQHLIFIRIHYFMFSRTFAFNSS